MNGHDIVLLKLIGSYCKDIIGFINNIDYGEFKKSDLISSACVLKLGQIGENVKKLSNEFKGKHKNIEWHEITGLRNRIIHEYTGLDWDLIWEIIKRDIPTLLSFTETFMGNL